MEAVVTILAVAGAFVLLFWGGINYKEETKMHDDEWDAFLKDGKFYLVDTIRPHHTYKDDKGKPIVFDDLASAKAAADARQNAMVLTPGKTAGWGNQPL